MALGCLLGALAWLAHPAPARAHQTSMKELTLHVVPGAIEAELDARRDDVAAVIGRGGPGDADAAWLTDPALGPAVASWVAVSVIGGACAIEGTPRAQAKVDPRWLTVAWTLRCPPPTRVLRLDFENFFLLDAAHTMIVRIAGYGAAFDTLVTAEDTPLELRLEAPPVSFWRWLRLGVEHILSGADHVCFVLALLLAALLQRREPGPLARADVRRRPEPARWAMRAPLPALRATALLITAFSVAHSLTLIAAALGWVALPTRLVETAIAASIGFAAMENIIRPDAPRRWALTFTFGLVHGLGFARALQELLPADHVRIPLIAFNLGVEFGQMMIVAVGLPFLLMLGRALGPGRYRRFFLPTCSAVLVALALIWSVERAFDLVLW